MDAGPARGGSMIRLQLALQGGGAKVCGLLAVGECVQELMGRGHLGVSRVAGTSAGSIVAALLASGQDLGEVRRRIRGMPDADWNRLLPPVGRARMALRLIRGKPVMAMSPLQELLEELFDRKGLVTLGDLSDRTGIAVSLVAANLSEGRKQVYDRADDLVVSSILHSCALPFVFRTGSSSPVIVDGGICDNLPSEELGTGPDDGHVIGVSFPRDGARDRASVVSFAVGLLDTAMSNSMDRARRQIGRDRVFSIATELRTFDFEKVRSVGMGPEYDKIKLEAKDWFEPLLSRVAAAQRVVIGDPGNEPRENLLASLSRVYASQHASRPVCMRRIVLEVTAHCLLPEADERKRAPDSVSELVILEPGDRPIDCYRMVVSSADAGSAGRLWTIDATDSAGAALAYTMLPARSVEPDGYELREVLLFFDPPIAPGQPAGASPPFHVRLSEQVYEGMKPLAEGQDFMRYTLRRAVTRAVPVSLVLYVPDGFPVLQLAADQPGQPDSVSGHAMTVAELHPYKMRAPQGFRPVGWTGDLARYGQHLGVRFRWK